MNQANPDCGQQQVVIAINVWRLESALVETFSIGLVEVS